MGSQPAGSAVQKNCVCNPKITPASSSGNPISLFAASQVAPHGAPFIIFTAETLPSIISTSIFGFPKKTP